MVGSGIVWGSMFFPFCFLLISSFVRFLCYLRIFGAENYHFNGICNILEFESIILHGICNILVLLAHLGLVDGFFGVGLVQGWFRVYLGLVLGWFRVYLGLV